MKIKLIAASMLTTYAALFAASGSASAHERWRYEIDKRQARHMELIREGRQLGMLTWNEVRQLRGEQFRIKRKTRAALADGTLDWTERQSIRYAQDAANTHIFQQRNDGERRWSWR